MEQISLERQGRIVIPKKLRQRLKLREKEKLRIEIFDNKLVLKPFKSREDFISAVAGCVRGSKINPLEVKKMWGM